MFFFYSTFLKNEANKTFFYDEENLFSKFNGLKYIPYVMRLKVFENILKGIKQNGTYMGISSYCWPHKRQLIQENSGIKRI